MDNPQTLKHVSLCAGYGGIDLGLARALGAVRTITFVEIEAFAIINLVKKIEAGHLDECPIFTDLKALPWELYRGRVDILSGGFPCQPFSSAGRRAGDSDPRHLWPYITDGIRRMGHPPLVFLENVEGIISSKLKGSEWADPEGTPVLLHVLRELERMGYQATAGVFSASEVGAPHQRKRVFILGCRSNLSATGRGLFDGLLRDTEREQAVGNDSSWSEQSPYGRWRSERRGTQVQDREPSTDNAWRRQEVAHTCDHSGRRSRASIHSQGGAVDRRGESIQSKRYAQNVDIKYASHAWPAPRGADQYLWEPPRVTLEHTDKEGLPRRRDAETTETKEGRGIKDLHLADTGSQDRGKMGNTKRRHKGSPRGEPGTLSAQNGDWKADMCTRANYTSGESIQREIKPKMGRDADGAPSGLGYAELCESVDNRTDELRLLGNGVVPATAEHAFRVLWKDLRSR